MAPVSGSSSPPWPTSGPSGDLRSDVGQLLWVGFGGLTPDDAITSLIQDHHVGSVIYFRRNVSTAQQIAQLSADLQALRPHPEPLTIAVDQEGGSVARLRGIATDFPSMAILGATGDEGLAHAYGTALGEELTALGIGLDFAPVVDVNTNPDNPVIGSRAFGAQPDRVARMAVAQLRGMEAAGLLSCVKHFPGHGDTRTDSHKELPVIPHDMARLEAVELAPFAAAIAAGAPAIMTAHVLFEAVDPHLPATLSPAVVDGLLRQRMGYGGVVLTDDLEMAAIVDGPGIEDAVLLGLEAGVDGFLICHRIERQIAAWEALVRAGERSVDHRDRIRGSAARIRHMKALIDLEAAPAPAEAASWMRGAHALSLAQAIRERGAAALAEGGAPLPNDPDPTQAPDLTNA